MLKHQILVFGLDAPRTPPFLRVGKRYNFQVTSCLQIVTIDVHFAQNEPE